ncbi:hypothetical protein [Streptomyces mirabilis]|uniref:hypothetical protein n=1 Tax=Streptomyces mirabilis TaxID=68239 RepID=UPI00381A46C0
MPGAQGAAEAAKAASAARTAAAESGMLRGATAANGTHPGGMPYMPMGGMGGTPMGAGQRGGERERTTWLTEDEDIWGADCDTSDGVIGRPRPDRPPQR